MNLTREDWKACELRLRELHGRVHLLIDGYHVTLMLGRVSTYKNAIVVYVDNQISPKLLSHDSEERGRFYRPITRKLLPVTARMKKDLGARRAARVSQECGTHTQYSFYWKSFPALKRHLRAHNKSIEMAMHASCASASATINSQPEVRA